MEQIDRLPALPLIANDPYFSVWLPGDALTDADSMHWSGAPKPLRGSVLIDGRTYRILGKGSDAAMKTTALRVTPTQTVSVTEAAGVRLTLRFWSPALPDALDELSTPITFADIAAESADGRLHAVEVRLFASDMLCYDGCTPPPMRRAAYRSGEMRVAYTGQKRQNVLGHSGDHVTIDWGYLYMASPCGNVEVAPDGLRFCAELACAPGKPGLAFVLLGYDDVAAIDYFGVYCRAWYMRNGRTLPEALRDFAARHDELFAACVQLDEAVLSEARVIGGEDYALLAAASWRHTFAAHKLICTPDGDMAFLSKENDSNGCIGTVDVSYPSQPLFLRFCPELVNALCRPVLAFASMPVWEDDFAPHDVGRYPHATGQAYAARELARPGDVLAPYYLYPAGTDAYNPRYQMPVEECGNMIVMLEAAISFGASDALARRYAPLLARWARYLDEYGEDPGEQLCTDDFAGHLAHNVNLSAKAVVGLACYARLLRRVGEAHDACRWEARAKALAARWLERAYRPGGSPLTFDGGGWSMKYNLVWDRLLGLGLFPEAFYRDEIASYIGRLERYGLPLDSRADYTKSDWIVWTASMAQDEASFRALIAPLARYLRESPTRVPFSDWYDARTGRYVAFIARSVQGGVYMPMLMRTKARAAQP